MKTYEVWVRGCNDPGCPEYRAGFRVSMRAAERLRADVERRLDPRCRAKVTVEEKE